MLHLTLTWELVFTGRDLNHAMPDCDLEPFVSKVKVFIMLHLLWLKNSCFTVRGLNHATPDCDLGPSLYS